MQGVTEIRSLKAFRAWLRAKGHKGEWFGRIGFDERSLLVSQEHSWKFQWDQWTPDELPLYPLTLPASSPPSAAKTWWKDVFEQRRAEFFRHGTMPIYCIASIGVWRALPDWCVMRTKSEWEVIVRDTFEAGVGPVLWREMLGESRFLGFSIRQVPDAVTDRRKR